jgi:glyoxylase-like metal-dependent hydrolase (beta-lactamase superfamily II)
MSFSFRFAAGAVLAAAVVTLSPAHATDAVSELRLYELDCGSIDVKDMAPFSDTFEYNGKAGRVVDPCYVIRGPKGTLLWDTGLGDKFAQTPGGVDNGGFHIVVAHTLPDQLKDIGLTPADITFMAFSHFHFDHTGNANEFPGATWIINKTELAWAESGASDVVDTSNISGYKTAKTKMIDGDYDVFGDGSAMILRAPGHTPGHQVLMLKLKKAGTVILSGDLYHTRENRLHRRVPMFNTERADSLASMDRIETILKNTKGKLYIQHDARDFALLPKPPGYLD